MATILDRIATGRPVVLDGAMGTEIDRRRAPIDLAVWSAKALESRSDVVLEIHEDYVRAGAEIQTTNTFATARHVLEAAGLGDKFEAFNRDAVELCKQAIAAEGGGKERWIAGAMSTYAESSDRSKLPPIPQLRANYAEQAALLAAEGVDMFVLEMLTDVEVTLAAVEGAASTGLPVTIGFTCTWGDDGETVVTRNRLMESGGSSFEEILLRVLDRIPDGTDLLVSPMHCDLDVTGAALEVVSRNWDGPIVVYPNSGDYEKPHWVFETVCTPAEFVDHAQLWIDGGADIVGGCCGVGPEHIRALAEHLA